MRRQMSILLYLFLQILNLSGVLSDGQCPGKILEAHDYSSVTSAKLGSSLDFAGLPGFTRSAYFPDHALIAPESRVWAGRPGWTKATTAHIISPASGANFAMSLADLTPGSEIANAPEGVERFIFVLNGDLEITPEDQKSSVLLKMNHYAYLPANYSARVTSATGAGLLVYERMYAAKATTVFQHGFTEDSPLLPTPGEVFRLRKLLPQTTDYDFNVHVMDFAPGEYLNVKEVHYNQHGLLLLEGQGIYRLGNSWYPVQAGDAIWMAPYVPQWYAALGTTNTRYIIYKDTTVDPLFS